MVWRERGNALFRFNWWVVRAFFGVVFLHGLWDWTAGAIPIEIDLPILMVHWRFVDLMLPEVQIPIPGLIIGLIGLWTLIRILRQANREQRGIPSNETSLPLNPRPEAA